MTLSLAERTAEELEEVMKECMITGKLVYKGGPWNKTINGVRLQGAIDLLRSHELVPKPKLRGGSPIVVKVEELESTPKVAMIGMLPSLETHDESKPTPIKMEDEGGYM